MANPIAFQMKADPKVDLERRLAVAPREHAEALLVAWDLLQAAHDQGLLDMAHGAVAAKDEIFATLAKYGRTPEGVAAVRNGIALLRVLMSVDPDLLDRLARAAEGAHAEHRREEKAPSLWTLMRRMTCEDSRRGFSFMTLLVSSLGKALKG
jgi:uncharacterized protein YjgD (DUF1641 family)